MAFVKHDGMLLEKITFKNTIMCETALHINTISVSGKLFNSVNLLWSQYNNNSLFGKLFNFVK